SSAEGSPKGRADAESSWCWTWMLPVSASLDARPFAECASRVRDDPRRIRSARRMRRAARKRQEDYSVFKFLSAHGSEIATLIKIFATEYKLSVLHCRCEIYNGVQNILLPARVLRDPVFIGP